MFTIIFAFILLAIKWIISLFSEKAGRSFAEFIPIAIIAFVVILVIYAIVAHFAFERELYKFKSSNLPIKLFTIIALLFLILGSTAQYFEISPVTMEIVGCVILLIIAFFFIGLFHSQSDENGVNFFMAIPKFLVQEIKFPAFFVIAIFALTISMFQVILVILSWILAIITVPPKFLSFKDLLIVQLFSKY